MPGKAFATRFHQNKIEFLALEAASMKRPLTPSETTHFAVPELMTSLWYAIFENENWDLWEVCPVEVGSVPSSWGRILDANEGSPLPNIHSIPEELLHKLKEVKS